MYYDDSNTIFLAKNNKSGSQSKYINIKFLAIRERVKENKMIIGQISVKLMIVDPLTKGMPLKGFKDHVSCIGLGSIMKYANFIICNEKLI